MWHCIECNSENWDNADVCHKCRKVKDPNGAWFQGRLKSKGINLPDAATEAGWRGSLVEFRATPNVKLEHFLSEAERELKNLTNFQFSPEEIQDFLAGASLASVIDKRFWGEEIKRKEAEKILIIEKKTKEISDLLSQLKPIIFPHLNTLCAKRKQLFRYDPYGKPIPDDWLNEVDYFIQNIVLQCSESRLRDMKRYRNPIYERTYGVIQTSTLWLLKNSENENPAWPELEPTEFESECAEKLRRLGWVARTTKGSGDQGIDIIAQVAGIKLVVQCKRYKDKIGNSAVQEIIAGQTFERANYAAVIGTGIFTPSALQLAATANVILLHPDQIGEKLSPGCFGYSGVVATPNFTDGDFEDWFYSLPPAIAGYEYTKEKSAETSNAPHDDAIEGEDLDDAQLLSKAIGVLKASKRASTSTMQRRLRIGYARAATIMDILEKRGIVGPENGSTPREILVDLDSI